MCVGVLVRGLVWVVVVGFAAGVVCAAEHALFVSDDECSLLGHGCQADLAAHPKGGLALLAEQHADDVGVEHVFGERSVGDGSAANHFGCRIRVQAKELLECRLGQTPSSVRPFWQEFQAALGIDASGRFYEAFHFDDNAADANALAKLVLNGTKGATAGLLWSSETTDKQLPSPGVFSVVTSWDGEPPCVIETSRVGIVPCDEVTERFAAAEGECDKTLRHWREVHWAYFSRECERVCKEPDLKMPVIYEQFSVAYATEV